MTYSVLLCLLIFGQSTCGTIDFGHIDVWSSIYTWGGDRVPEEGEIIIIPAGMTVLLDTDTPRLDLLLIKGGKLIFDEKDVELKANVIMITDGGLLQVGTETVPFQHKGVITLYGHPRSKELPIYGTKVLALTNGTLDLHGTEVPLTWTRLATTAAPGALSITLVDPVEWNVGDEIVIATTGDYRSQKENEKKFITAISQDKKTLTLDLVLQFEHLGTMETFDGTTVDFRAEVGLLTHNVVVRGNIDLQVNDTNACNSAFHAGEFATQTCFQGRFGEEKGDDQFGAVIFVHSRDKNAEEVNARIAYTEVKHAGQAFRPGRYPIHFHLHGDMSKSYVRGCSVHSSFNRAVNIHGARNITVEKTVIYNIMGGGFVLENGTETGNMFKYNLAVLVRKSSRLLSDDTTPAAFWVNNPNNTVQHNAAAGGTHFGYWYRMHNYPGGPSCKTDVCCIQVPLGAFFNNSAHSFGRFGLWVFPNYIPMQGRCSGTQAKPAVFRNLTSWNNDKGTEAANIDSLQFDGFVLVQNKRAGYEGQNVFNVSLYTDDSPMLKNSLVVGKIAEIQRTAQGCTSGGVVFPHGAGFCLKNVRFINFAEDGCSAFRWTRTPGTCSLICGGFTYHTEQITYVNAPNKAVYTLDFEGMVKDKDGTLLGKSTGATLIPTTGSLPTDCEAAPEFSIGQPASICPAQYKFHRFTFNDISPTYLENKRFLVTNQYGASSAVYRMNGLTGRPEWMCVLVSGETYTFVFENAAQLKNISFMGQFDDFSSSDYLFVKFGLEKVPDRLSIDGGQTFISATIGLDPATAKEGDWEWNNIGKEIKLIVTGKKRSRRDQTSYGVDRPWSFTAYSCFFTDCIPRPVPNTIPPATQRPLQYQNWEDETLWKISDGGYVTNVRGSYGVPQPFDDVLEIYGEWVVVNGAINKLGTLLLEGVLEFSDSTGANYEINADFIIILGGRLIIGWPDDPFDGLANIVLRGNHSRSYFTADDGPILGSKAIGVFGGLDLFGKDVGKSWTQLATTAMPGSNQIVLKEPVRWSTGSEIVIGPTSYNLREAESFKINSISPDMVTLTLNDTLRYKHIAVTEALSSGFVVDVAAAVGLLTRNIRIVGEDYANLYTESDGARVHVGHVTYKGSTFDGYARLSNVEFCRTGQKDWTDEYDLRSSVVYAATGVVNRVKPSFVSKCSFHNGFNGAVGAFGVDSLNITDNVVFGAVGNGLRTRSSDTQLRHNLVVLIVGTNALDAGIDGLEAKNLILQDNLVTGSETIGYRVATQYCTDMSDTYRNNMVSASLVGVAILPTDKLTQTECAKIGGFIAWKNRDYGIYYQNIPSVTITNNVLIENTNGIIAFVLGPNAAAHLFDNKTIVVNKNTFVGATNTFDCTSDVLPTLGEETELIDQARPVRTSSRGMIGLIFPNFYQASNRAPEKLWKGSMSYNAIGGLMRISDNMFANYKSYHCNGDYAVATNDDNHNVQHPIEAERTTLVNVDSTNKIYFHRPNVNECVDAGCDALKKALFKDKDGSFLGHVGAVVPQSEFEWDGDQQIPKEMVTDMNGHIADYNDLMPNKDKEYLLHFTGTTPKHMRYRLLNVGSSETVKLSVWYSRSNRLDVFVDNQYVMATNAQIDSQGRYKLTMPEGNEFEPQLINTAGTNYFDKDNGLLTLIIKGSKTIDVITKKNIIVSFSMPSVDAIDGDNIIENMAAFLNIPLDKVRISNVAGAQSESGRKKRQTSEIIMEMEIGDEPTLSPQNTAPNSIDYEMLLNLAGKIVSECQARNISISLNVPGGCTRVQVPSRDTESPTITYDTPKPYELVFNQDPVPDYEGLPLRRQPKLRVTDITGNRISSLGTAEYPWQLTASIRADTGNPLASLNGTLCVNSSRVWFNFTDLAISHMGSGYVLDFNMTFPTSASNFAIASTAMDVARRPLKSDVHSQNNGDIKHNARFPVPLDLGDKNTNGIIPDKAWRGDGNDEGLKPFIVAIIVILAVVPLVAMAVLLPWRLKFKHKEQAQNKSNLYMGNAETLPIENALLRKNLFKFRNPDTTCDPLVTCTTNMQEGKNVPPHQYSDYFKQTLTGPFVSARPSSPEQPMSSAMGDDIPKLHRPHSCMQKCDRPLQPVGGDYSINM